MGKLICSEITEILQGFLDHTNWTSTCQHANNWESLKGNIRALRLNRSKDSKF